MKTTHPILIAGQWCEANAGGTFHAENPRTKTLMVDQYPISTYADVEKALAASAEAFEQLLSTPRETIARFLENYADRIDARSNEICQMAHAETALPIDPRLSKGELPRTTNQLRQAAAACRDQGWSSPVLDTQNNLRACHAAIGPVAVFGPNNFPLAYNGISGGDFASAIAAGNPVIAKSHPLHPGTTRMLAEEALLAMHETGMPIGSVQMLYAIDYADGERMIYDSRLAAVGFTGGRVAGLKLKQAADLAGKPIYLEMSSINPVFVMEGALQERFAEIAEELKTSCLMGAGQFCTSPGLIVLPSATQIPETEKLIALILQGYASAPVGTLLSKSGELGLAAAVEVLQSYGAELLCGGVVGGGTGYSYANTILKVSGNHFLEHALKLQTEAFGNATLIVEADSVEQAAEIARQLEGNLTGSIYSAKDGRDDARYDLLARPLRQRVGRLLNDKMPTGVAVSAAMNHGGPYPATGHPVFTSVGFPGSIARFSMLQSFDNVRENRLPEILRNANPTGTMRRIDGRLTTESI